MAVLASQQPQLIFNGSFLFSSPNLQFHHRSATIFRWRFGRDQGSNLVTCRTKGQAFRTWPILMYASTKASSCIMPVSSGKGDPGNEVIMVDPLEAKRLASKQMEQIKAKEKFKRRRQIEAINGAWAMIGLTSGLVIEGQTGKSILAQLAGYLSAITPMFLCDRLVPLRLISGMHTHS